MPLRKIHAIRRKLPFTIWVASSFFALRPSRFQGVPVRFSSIGLWVVTVALGLSSAASGGAQTPTCPQREPQRFSGVGLEMGFDPAGSMSVLRALDNSPAARSGLQAGDRVVAVDGVPVARLKGEAAARIRGETGSSVNLTVRRGESEFDAVLTREEITMPPRSVVGIGVTLGASKKGEPMIQTVLPNSPASEAALRSGDIVVSVDGKPVGQAADGAIQGLLRGEEGVPVMIGIRRSGLVTDYSITRLRFVPGC